MFGWRRPGERLDPAKFPRQAALKWRLLHGGRDRPAEQPARPPETLPEQPGTSPGRGGWTL
ncbi:MAG: hypothetical protein ACLGIN_09715 [Candidatus Sericytochromatia bacterium]